MRRRAWIALLFLVAATAHARNADGFLDVIITPNNGVPVIVAPGETFEATLTERAALRLTGSNGTAPALAPEWTELPGAMHRAVCPVPSGLAPGTYALEAVTEEGRADINIRALFLAEPAKDYAVIHLTDVHIGKANRDPDPETRFRSLLEHVNGISAAFVLITGDLTEHGSPEQFRRFLEVLDICELPTFVCAGNHDRQAQNYERVFGPLVYSFEYGPDGFLVFDTKDFLVADRLEAQMGELERLRRAIKPQRWSIGATHRYEPMMSMRSQLILFVDNPLDSLIFGHWHRETDIKRVPWGTTPIIATPAAVDGAWRLILVTQTGIHPQPVQTLPGAE